MRGRSASRRLSAVVLSLSLGAALPFASAFVGAAAAQTACPPPKVQLLINPTVSQLPSGQTVASGGAFACVTVSEGVIGGSPLPTCQARGVLAAVNTTVVGDTLTRGTILCVSLADAPVPAPPGGLPGLGDLGGLIGTLLDLLTGLLGGGLPLPLP
jgi:hypothetical protein